MKPGDILEVAIWVDGRETPEEIERFRTETAKEKMDEGSVGFVHGPVYLVEKQIGEDRVPPVPDHIQGPNVRLLVAESRILCYAPH